MTAGVVVRVCLRDKVMGATGVMVLWKVGRMEEGMANNFC